MGAASRRMVLGGLPHPRPVTFEPQDIGIEQLIGQPLVASLASQAGTGGGLTPQLLQQACTHLAAADPSEWWRLQPSQLARPCSIEGWLSA